jgi:hypothetical protein
LTKLSILFLYSRILATKHMRMINHLLIATIIVCNIWTVIAMFISCIPLQAVWDPSVKGWCLGLGLQLGNSILHVVTDFVIFILPLPVLFKLQLNRRKKIGLMLVFSIGFL